jgi:hypothetical protein
VKNLTVVNTVLRRRRCRTSTAERRQWVEAWERSDQTQEEFAATHGLSVGTLRNWIRGHVPGGGKAKAVPDFREISIGEILSGSRSVQAVGWAAEIRLPSGVVIALGPSAGIDRVKELLEAVRC